MRNPLKPQPRTFGQSMRHAVKSSLLLFVPGAALLAFAAMQPLEMSYTAPESADSAVVKDKAQRQAERAATKCEALPAGTLPGGAIIEWTDERGTRYTEDPGTVSMAFDLAVGALDMPENSRVGGFTLCL